jgi:PAS domain S-box-containing protein
LFESAQDAIIIFKPDGEVVLDVNQKACEMYGINKDEFVGMSLEKISKNIPDGKRHVAKTLLEGVRYQFETTQYKSDGTEIELEISASVIEYKNEQAILSINRDITDRKQSERALRQSEERYRNLFETMTQGVIYQAEDGRIISANPAAEHLLGLTINQLRGLSSKDPRWRALKEDGSDFPGEEHPAMIALKTGIPVRSKVMGVYNPKIKDHKWLLVDAIPEFLPGAEKPHQVFTTFSDITPLRHAEKIQKAFFRISEASSSAATLEGLFETIHSIVRELIAAENFYIALFDNKEDTISFAYFVDEKDPHPKPRKLGYGLTDYVIRENKSLVVSKEEFKELKNKKGISLIGSAASHWLGVPLRIDEEVIGAVVIQEYAEDGKPYSEEEEKLLSTISNQIALSIQRKRFSDALAESEKNYRTIFNTAPVGIFQSDVEGNLITVNNSFLNILGYDNPEEMMNLEMEEFYFNKSDRKQLLKRLLKNKSIVDVELEWQKKNGEKIWIELSAYVVKMHDGSNEHFEGFIKDVTQRKHDEELILQLSSGIEQSPTSVIITNLDGNIEYVNPRFLEQTGYTFDEIKGQNPRLLKSGELDKTVYDELWKTISSGKQWRGELLNKKKNGELYWELAFIFPLYDSNGKIRQYLGIKIDITDRKILENEIRKYQEHLSELIEQRTEELRMSEQKFKALAENSDDLIMRFSLNHEVLYMNPAVYRIISKKNEELIGKQLSEFDFENETIKMWKKALDKVIANKKKYRTEFMIKNDLWIDWVLIPEFDQVGQLISIFSFGRDITAMKNVENELFQKDRLLQGVAAASNILFTLEDFDIRIKNALEVIGKAADVDSAYIFESQFKDNSQLYKLIYEWNNTNTSTTQITSLYNDTIITNKVIKQLKSGMPVVGLAADFPKNVEKILKSESIKCIINLPIEVFG